MNRLTIIGNLTRDPELRTTSTGLSVCSFTVAVNRRKSGNSQNNQPEADFFRVSAWRELGENCQKYLAKGRKVCVVGPVSVSTYTNQNDGKTYANLEVMANEVEFLTPRSEGGTVPTQQTTQAAPPPQDPSGFTPVDMPDDDLPF